MITQRDYADAAAWADRRLFGQLLARKKRGRTHATAREIGAKVGALARGATRDQLVAQVKRSEEYRSQEDRRTPPAPGPAPARRWQDHDPRVARGCWLYPGDGRVWWQPGRMMAEPAILTAHLQTREVQAFSDHVPICLNTTTSRLYQTRSFNALQNARSRDRVLRALDEIHAAGCAPWVTVMMQGFYEEELGGSHPRAVEHVEASIALVKDHCRVAMAWWEMGDVYDGNHLLERTEISQAMRRGAGARLYVAVHERGLVGVPVSDFRGIGRRAIAALQTKFGTPIGGQGRPQDRVTSRGGRHVYDGAFGFLASEVGRMAARGFGPPLLFEYALPRIRPWRDRGSRAQRWSPTHTLAEAQAIGATLARSGVRGDMTAPRAG